MTMKNFENNNILLPLDTGEGRQYDRREKLSSSDTSTLSSLGLTQGSIMQQCRMDSRLCGNDRGECGRSMVEMLGTLAIIGVLFIGGIAGYSYGMDKYRANQTVNDVMLRAVDVMTQLSQGKDPDLEPEWGTKGTVYDMIEIQDTTNNTWGIVVDGVPSRVCQMVGDALKNQATVYVGNAERNDTTASDPCESSDSNTMEFYFNTSAVETDGCKTDADCGENNYCDMGLCFNGVRPEVTARVMDTTCETDADCNKGWDGSCAYCASGHCIEASYNNNKACILKENEIIGKCNAGECLPIGCTYDTNKCDDKEYCASPNTNTDNSANCKAFYEGETGVCVAVNKTFYRQDIGGVAYYISYHNISYWDAVAGCQALGGKKLLSIDDWMEGGYAGGNSSLSELGINLRRIIGSGKVWTEQEYHSCYTFFVDLASEYYDNYGLRFTADYCVAVCK